MIKFESTEKRKFIIKNNEETICSLDLFCNTVTNKFEEITKFIEDCSIVLGKEFDDWFVSYIKEYRDNNYDCEVILNHIPTLKSYADKYLDKLNIDYGSFINEGKRSKTSIYFDVEEIKNITKVSYYLKLFSVIYQDKTMKPVNIYYKKIYNILIKDITTNEIISKIFDLVSSKINKYKVTDSYMWEFIKIKYCKTTDMHIMHIFSWIIHNIIIICDAKQNPISFVSCVINTSIKWILQDVYKDSIIYSESINTEDANMISGKDKLETFAYNDTIAKLLIVAYNCLGRENIEEDKFKEITNDKKTTPTISKYITYPILCKALDIPYKHLITIPSEHAYILNILVFSYLNKQFKKEYPIITNLLLKYNTSKEIKKTTYSLVSIDTFHSTFVEFLTTKDTMFAFDFYSNIVGKLIRNTYGHFKNGNTVESLPKIEKDIITFYNNYFSGKLDDECKKLGEELANCI